MAEDQLNARINLESNASSVINKLIRDMAKLSNTLGDVAGVFEDLSRAQNQTVKGSAEVGKALAKNIESGANQAEKSVLAITKALQSSGLSGAGRLVPTDVFKGTIAEVEEFRNRLTQAGDTFANFLQRGKVDTQLEGFIGTVNKLRQALDLPKVEVGEFLNAKEAGQEIRLLEQQIRDVSDAAAQGISLDFDPKTTERANEELRQFRTVLEDIINQQAKAQPTFSQSALASFAEARDRAKQVSQEINDLRQQAIAIGPAVQSGSENAIREFSRLNKSIRELEQEASGLGSSLAVGMQEFGRQTGSRNLALGQLGFRQITLDDIFPTAEQQKVADLQNKINAEVLKSVEQGAVRDSVNLFLQTGAQLQNVDENIVRLTGHLPRLRYALYDVSTTATVFGGILLGAVTAATTLAASFERSFADVIRTTGVTGKELDRLRNQLVDLSKSIPVGFDDLANIATLAGQLNIANTSVANFTETVAKFSATTDVTIEGAATAFGRLDQLVNGVNGQFDKLGSSILAVGINAVATESDIVAIATQLASIANIAGFSADELIGFSSALASVGTRPELARGTFTRLFSEINEAVTLSTDSLDKFSRLAGQSSEEFIDAWRGGRGAEQIVEILRGLSVQGAEAELSLRALGITSVRDIPTLLKLAQSVEEVERQLAIAKIGFIAGTELNEQYSVITDTLSEKLVVLKNSFQALVATLAGVTGPLTFLVDVAIKVIGVLEDLASNPITGFIFTLIGGFTAVIGILSVAAGAVARLGANMSGFLTTMIEVRTAVGVTQLGIAGLNTTINTTTGSATAAAGALNTLSAANAGLAATAGAAAGAQGLGAVNASIRAGLAGTTAATVGATGLGAALQGLFRNSKLFAGLGLAARFAGWGAVLFSVVGVVDLLAKQFGLWGSNVESAIDDVGPYIEAIKQDTLDWSNATDEAKESFTTFEGSLAGAGQELGSYVKLAVAASEENDVLRSLVDEATGAIETQTFAIGENTKAIIRNDLVRKLYEASQDPGFFATPEDRTLAQARRGFIGAVSDPEIAAALAERGFDFTKFVDLVVTGQQEAADSMLRDLKPAALDIIETMDGISPKGISDLAYAAQFGYNAIKPLVGLGSDVQNELTLMELGAAAAGESIIDTGDAASGATSRLEELKIAFNGVFGEVNEIENVYNALQGLDSAIQENGTSFDTLSANGIANLIALQNATIATVAGAEALGLDASSAIALAYAQLVASGVDAAQALLLVTRAAEGLGVEVPGANALAGAVARLEGIFAGVKSSASGAAAAVKTFGEAASELTSSLFEGVNAGRATEEAIFSLGKAFGEAGNDALYAGEEMQGAINAILQSSGDGETAVANLAALFVRLSNTVGSQSDPSLQALRQTISAVAQEFGITNAQVENFIKLGGGDLANINLDNFNTGIKAAQKEVRTLLDYAGDLEKVISRAFDIRFSRTFSIDSIAEAWENLGKTVAEAREEVDELLAAQQDLSADRAIKEYFLSVAQAYGDGLRAAKLREELADLDREQIKAAQELEAAQQIAGGDLTTQGPGARQNRQQLLSLVQEYQDYITVLAESGASQAELTAETERARREFTEQARELGFQESVVLQYARAFDDVQTAISSVERNITVEANVNPALQALNELNASLQTQITAANDLNRALNQPVKPPTTPKKVPIQPVVPQPVVIPFKPGYVPPKKGIIETFLEQSRQQQLKFPTGPSILFDKGGFTGRGGKMEPAGIVHRGEYVVPKQYVNQSTGMPDPSFLAQMQSGMRNYFMGGFVGGGGGTDGGTMMVELSPFDRKLLADAGNVQLRLNGRVVAEATNQNNFDEARRGSN